MAVGVPVLQMARVRQNYLANRGGGNCLLSARSGMVFDVYDTWVSGIGRTDAVAVSNGPA